MDHLAQALDLSGVSTGEVVGWFGTLLVCAYTVGAWRRGIKALEDHTKEKHLQLKDEFQVLTARQDELEAEVDDLRLKQAKAEGREDARKGRS